MEFGGATDPGTGLSLTYGSQTNAGTYTVLATNATTSCTNNMTGNVTVSINPLPTAYNVTGGGAYCSGGNRHACRSEQLPVRS